MTRLASLALVAFVSLAAASTPTRAQPAGVNAEAQVFFERGNRLFAQSARARGLRRAQLLEEALQAYVSTLRIVRSRNALFNAAIVLDRLERPHEAFTYLVEYLAIEGLSPQERNDGEARLARLRPRVATVRVTSEPAGAEVFVDRLDLAPRGRAPLELAVHPGHHLLIARAPHHADARLELEAQVGETREATLHLTPEPVSIELTMERGPDDAEAVLLVDGARVPAGPRTLPPGDHVATLVLPDGRRHDERFTLRVGDAPRRLTLRAPPREPASLVVQSDRSATVYVDDAPVGQGAEVRVAVAPGAHTLRVEVEDAPPQTRALELAAGAESLVRVRFGPRPTERRFGAWPGVFAGTSAALVATWGGVALGAVIQRQSFDDRCPSEAFDCRARFNRVERLNLSADLLLGIGAAAIVTTIVLFTRRERAPSAGETARLELHLSPRFSGFEGRF